jgi:ABC-type lipoprotein release transport system permease subunit
VFGIGPHDPLTLVLACVALPAVAIIASLIPAMRAARADPLIAIRAE